MVNVALSWFSIDWLPSNTWSTDILPELRNHGLKENDIRRSVYVIRLNGEYCIDYPWGTSPTLYIGEGNFFQRISSHRIWVRELEEFVGKFQFQVQIAIPRVRANPTAYLDSEAAVLIRFKDKFGSAPLWNSQMEKRRHSHYVYSNREIDRAICKGQGTKYKWAFKPMKSSPFFDDYIRTHTEK